MAELRVTIEEAQFLESVGYELLDEKYNHWSKTNKYMRGYTDLTKYPAGWNASFFAYEDSGSSWNGGYFATPQAAYVDAELSGWKS